jgi:Protein of unknown function (DUF3306)
MSDSENFLNRWSRRKREADAQSEKTDDEVTATSASAGKANPDNPVPGPAMPQVPEFDISKLPPIESIGADTDISVFMQAGVPSALRHAALRRVWSADPAIRGFMGLNENFWDAAGPDGVPGFGDLDPNLDVKRLISELFGETPRESAQAVLRESAEAITPDSSDTLASGSDNSDGSTEGGKSPEQASLESGSHLSHRTENAATQENSQEPKRLVRRHGGALPE